MLTPNNVRQQLAKGRRNLFELRINEDILPFLDEKDRRIQANLIKNPRSLNAQEGHNDRMTKIMRKLERGRKNKINPITLLLHEDKNKYRIKSGSADLAAFMIKKQKTIFVTIKKGRW